MFSIFNPVALRFHLRRICGFLSFISREPQAFSGPGLIHSSSHTNQLNLDEEVVLGERPDQKAFGVFFLATTCLLSGLLRSCALLFHYCYSLEETISRFVSWSGLLSLDKKLKRSLFFVSVYSVAFDVEHTNPPFTATRKSR